MMNFVESLENGSVKNWYRRNADPAYLDHVLNEAEKDGYKLDTNSGLLFRQVYSGETIKLLGHSIIDIIFLRPVDVHCHRDIDEAFHVIDGFGSLYYFDGKKEELKPLQKGDEIFVPKNAMHSFRPNMNDGLEIRVACSGIFDPKEEVCSIPFNAFKPWHDYYKLFTSSKKPDRRKN